MKKTILTSLLLLFVFHLFSQQDSIPKKVKNELQIKTYASYGSNQLSNNFLSILVFGGEITTNIKTNALKKGETHNRIGAELNYEVQFINYRDTFLTKSPNWRSFFGFGSFTNYSSTYTNTVFETIFFGNKGFGDKKVDISGTNLFLSDFKTVTVGALHTKQKVAIGLSVVSGNKHSLYQMQQGYYQNINQGEQLLVYANGKTQESDSLKNGYLAFSGIGAAVYISKQIKNLLLFEAKNIGFAYWKRNPSVRNITNSLAFEGIELTDIYSNPSLSTNSTIDSILPTKESSPFLSVLPAIFTVDKVLNPNKTLQATIGFRGKINSNYEPYQYAGLVYQPFSGFNILGAISYGGYNNLEGRVHLSYNNKNLRINIGTDHVYGLLSKNGFGKSAYFTLNVTF